MATKTRFMDYVGDHDGDNPANWTAGLPQPAYEARISPVAQCHFSQGYTCLTLMVEDNVTTVTFDGGNWTFSDRLDLAKGTILVPNAMTVDGSLTLGQRPGSDCTRLSVQFTQARNILISAGSIPIGDVVLRTAGTGNYAQMYSLNCQSLDIAGELRFTSYAPVTVRGDFVIRTGATVNAAGNPMLTLHGNIWAEPGVWTWLAGAGRCNLAGVGDQTVDLGDMEGTFDPIYINKPSGRLVLQSDLQCRSLDHSAGILDPGGRSVTTLGDCRIQVGAKLAEPLDGSAWTVGGSLYWQGRSGDLLALRGTSRWSLSVLGEAVVHYADVAYSDARAGGVINALDGTSINGGNNLNWLLPPIQPFAVAAGCVQTTGALAGIPVVPTAVAGEAFVAAAEKGVVHA